MPFWKMLALTAVGIATAWTWLGFLVSASSPCGRSHISVAVAQYGIACVDATKWRERAALQEAGRS
jgi:hypothetical protein